MNRILILSTMTFLLFTFGITARADTSGTVHSDNPAAIVQPVQVEVQPPAVPQTPDSPTTPAPPQAIDELVKEGVNRGVLTHEVMERLSADQLHSLLLRIEKNRSSGMRQDVIVPIGVVGIVFVSSAVVIISLLLLVLKRSKMKHETIRMMIERGTPIPSNMFETPSKPKNDFRRGVILTALGASSVAYFVLNGFKFGNSPWPFGLILLLVGLGYLWIWKIDQQHKKNSPEKTAGSDLFQKEHAIDENVQEQV